MSRPLTSVVVPCHNGAATLAAQLQALLQQAADLPFEVVVVDNRSSDASAGVAEEVARSCADRLEIRVVSATEGASVAYARNAGTAAARGDRILYCDSDDVVRPGWVAAMTARLDDHAVAGGRMDTRRLNDDRVRAWTEAPAVDELPDSMRWLQFAPGCTLGVRADTWRTLDGFDEAFVGGHEEVDFCWRAQEHGGTVGFAPDAVVDYRLRESLRDTLRQRFSYGRTHAQLFAKHRDQPIPRTSWRREVRVLLDLLQRGPRECREGRGGRWLADAAWIAGRWRGDVEFRVRCPT